MIPAEIFPYSHVVFIILTIFYVLTIVSAIGVVISENRNPVKTLAWVTVLLLLPVVGFLLYAFFGRSLKNVIVITRKNKLQLKDNIEMTPGETQPSQLSSSNRQLAIMVNSLVEPHLFSHNAIEIFTNGADKFRAYKADLLSATDYINIQYYIFENDQIGHEISDILIQKAKEGVKVRFIYDHVGSWHIDMSFIKKLRKNGVEIYPFLRVTFPELANRVNWRNHRKITVIDGRVGYIGGMNIADRYVSGDKNGKPAWRDTHLRIRGEALSAMQYAFAVDWSFMRKELIHAKIEHLTETDEDAYDNSVQIVTSGPTDNWSNLALIFLKAISQAKKRVFIQTPYFLPSDSLLKALEASALSGVDVRVMIPEYPDSKLLRFASFSYVKECLEAGVKIYLYQPSMIHAKCVIVDDDFVSTGSTNFDFRSFEHNFECNAMIYGERFCSEMKAIFEKDVTKCSEATLEQWQQRPMWRKAVESLARLMGPIL
ncbi:MAG: cardiolipin synthase [Muribaculaceae bacterium]|nr:cardiolipin synthase [Muribaculaceae bacterium]